MAPPLPINDLTLLKKYFSGSKKHNLNDISKEDMDPEKQRSNIKQQLQRQQCNKEEKKTNNSYACKVKFKKIIS